MSPVRRRLAFAFAALALLAGAGFFIARHCRAPRGVTADSVKNIAYPAGLGDTAEWIQVKDGEGRAGVTLDDRMKAVKGWWEDKDWSCWPWDFIGARWTLNVDSSTLGAFAGQAAAAVIFRESGGGSGTFYSAALVVERQGDPVCVASAPLGDRTRILDARLSGDRIVLDLVCSGPHDAMCCPTQHERRTYGWSGKPDLDLLATEPLPAVPEKP